MDTTLPAFNLADLQPLLPELVLAGGAFALLMFDLFFDSKRRGWTHLLAMLLLLAVAMMIAVGVGGQGTVMRGMFVRDDLADLAKIFILLVSATGFVYIWPQLSERGLYKGEVPVLLLFAVLGMMLMVSAGSMVMVYVGLEMLALCSYALVAIDRDAPLPTEAAMKYFVLGSLASGLLLYGMSLIYGATGTLDLAEIYAANGAKPTLLLTGMAFVVAGIAFKFGAVPFHMWLPDVYQGAPTSITLFIGAAPKIAAFAMTYRLLETGLGPVEVQWRWLVAGLAAASLLVGNLAALRQNNFKRLLAFSTVSHVGFLLMGLAGGGQEGYGAALFYAIVYAITAVAAFGSIVVLSRAGFEAERIADLRGLAKRSPFMALMLLFVLASLTGLPPFIGFFTKLAVIRAAIEGGYLWLAIVGIAGAVVGAYYYLRVVKAMYFEAPEEGTPLSQLAVPRDDLGLRVVFGVNAALLLVMCLFLGPLMDWCMQVFAGTFRL